MSGLIFIYFYYIYIYKEKLISGKWAKPKKREGRVTWWFVRLLVFHKCVKNAFS